MKKNNLFGILFALIAFFTCYQNGSAETALCTPDCPDTPFITKMPLEKEFTYMGCRYVADYYLRKACDKWCDIMLWRVRALDPPPCSSCDVNKLLDVATAQIIHELNTTNTFESITGQPSCRPENPGECNEYWRVSKATCWSWYVNDNFNLDKPITPINYWGSICYCEYDSCCLTWYKVCMDDLGQIVVTEIESNSSGPCKNEKCTSVCD